MSDEGEDPQAPPATPEERRALARELHAQGQSLREIARALGVGKTTISRWVRDASAPSDRPPRKARKHESPWAAVIGLGVIIGSMVLPFVWALWRRRSDGA